MGQFIDTQQGLLSEAKQKRLEREHKKLDKERHEKQELELFYSLENMLYNTPKSTKQKQKQELENVKTRDFIIDKITGGDLKDGYILTQKYNTLLNKAYKPYNEEKNNYKQLEIKLHRTLQNTLERKQLHTRKREPLFSNSGRSLFLLT